MVQSEKKKINALHDLGYKIFLDRYAQKDMTRSTLAVGDTVIVVVDSKTGQREVGKVTALNLPQVHIQLLDGTDVSRDIENVDKPLETDPAQMMQRVASGIAAVEKSPEKRQLWAERFNWLLEDWKFVPAGRILTAAGTDQDLTFYNCYVVPSPVDSRGGIIQTLHQMTEIMSRGGGVGINISSLRPRQTFVKGVNGRSSGSVSWGALYSFVTGLIEQGGCFAPQERILTDKGLIPAEEIADRMDAGETFYAQTHEGLRKMTARFRNGVKMLYDVTTSRGYRTQITQDHKVGVMIDGKIETMALRYLQPGDEILLLMGEAIEGQPVPLSAEVDRAEYDDVRFPQTLNADLAYLVGYMMGDSTSNATRTELQFATSDAYPTIQGRLIESIERLFNLMPTLKAGAEDRTNIAIQSRAIMAWLAENALLKQAISRVPEAIFRSPASVMMRFIAGLMDANATLTDAFSMESAQAQLLQDVQMLLIANGIVSELETLPGHLIHRLNMTDAEAQARFAALVPAEKLADAPSYAWGNTANYGYNGRNADGLQTQAHSAEQLIADSRVLLDRITSITAVKNSDVFDFEVEDVHLLSGSGIYTSNSRRGALMLILNDWHPDVFDFINSKRQMGQITNANISVGVSDKFMDAVKADADWDLLFPDTSYEDYDDVWDGDLEKWEASGRRVLHYRTVKARELWHAIIESAWASAEPGVFFRERYNKMSNSWYYAPIVCTNPCGEQGLPGWGVCNLGALNLAKFYNEETQDVDWDSLDQAARYATRFLDNVIDTTPYFFEENRDQQLGERRVGLNNMGLAELLIKAGIRYGSDESVEFIDKLYGFLARSIYETSVELAQEKGAFPQFEADKFLQSGYMQSMPEDIREKVREYRIRNVTLTTQAPTGTTGTMVNTSTGIEPFFSWVYYRKSRLGLHEEQVPLVKEWHENNPEAESLPDYFVTAMDLSPEEHIKVQAAIQRWVDSSISKTCNVPNNYTVEQVSELYEYMYDMGCKGGTIYRDGSRDEQVLILKNEEEETPAEEKTQRTEAAVEQVSTPHKVYPRPKKLSGVTISSRTPFGTAYFTMNSDENGYPFEVFVTAPGKAGSDLQADGDALARMISLQLRTTAPANRLEMIKLVIDQLEGIGGSRSIGLGPTRVMSLPDALAGALKEHYFPQIHAEQMNLPMPDIFPAAQNHDNHTHQNGHTPNAFSGADMCPECRTISLIRAEGCRKCLTCGYSEC